MIFKYGCHNHLRSVVLAGPRLAPLRMRGTRPMTLSGGCACSSWWQIRPAGCENALGRVGGALGLLGRTFWTTHGKCQLLAVCRLVHLALESFQQPTESFQKLPETFQKRPETFHELPEAFQKLR